MSNSKLLRLYLIKLFIDIATIYGYCLNILNIIFNIGMRSFYLHFSKIILYLYIFYIESKHEEFVDYIFSKTI